MKKRKRRNRKGDEKSREYDRGYKDCKEYLERCDNKRFGAEQRLNYLGSLKYLDAYERGLHAACHDYLTKEGHHDHT